MKPRRARRQPRAAQKNPRREAPLSPPLRHDLPRPAPEAAPRASSSFEAFSTIRRREDDFGGEPVLGPLAAGRKSAEGARPSTIESFGPSERFGDRHDVLGSLFSRGDGQGGGTVREIAARRLAPLSKGQGLAKRGGDVSRRLHSDDVLDERLCVFLVAGEPSGDNVAARLMAALKRRSEGRIRFVGVGGERMIREGLETLFPMAELSVMGLSEILPRAPRLLRRLSETAAAIRTLRPDVVVTVDSPAFSFRLARRLQDDGLLLVHYVAPQLWAWGKNRARGMARLIDHLMVLFPFEPRFFEKFGLPCTFVGHPIIESEAGRGDGARFRARHGIAADAPVVSLLPGSRHTEIRALLPVFGRALELLAKRHTGLRALLPTVQTVAGEVAAATARWPVPTIVVTDLEEKYDAFAASNAALTKSGTSTLELALADVPMVVAYRLSPMTAFLARRLIGIEHVALVNLLVEREVVPELLQEACTPERLAAAVGALLEDDERCRAQRAGFAEVKRRLAADGASPSDRAAEVVLDVIAARERP